MRLDGACKAEFYGRSLCVDVAHVKRHIYLAVFSHITLLLSACVISYQERRDKSANAKIQKR